MGVENIREFDVCLGLRFDYGVNRLACVNYLNAPIVSNNEMNFSILQRVINGLLSLIIGMAAMYSLLILIHQPNPPVAALSYQTDAAQRVDRSPEARLLGVDVTGGVVAPAIEILGLAAGQRQGAAVLAVEGRPAAVYRLGEEIDQGWTLSAISGQDILIERAGQSLRITLPERTCC
jgi:hypothetical protein